MHKIFDPFKLSSTVRPLYWAQRQRRASTELVISTVCTMTSSGQAAHSISQTLTKTLAFHSSRIGVMRALNRNAEHVGPPDVATRINALHCRLPFLGLVLGFRKLRDVVAT
jgi:hypothetical protein